MARKIFLKEELRLLTNDEYLENIDTIPELEGKTWWLMDKGSGAEYGFVVGLNKMYRGDLVNTSHYVRPVLVTTYSSINVGEEILMYGVDWIKFKESVEDKYTTRHFFISQKPIGLCKFAENSNKYSESLIKEFCENLISVSDELDETEKEKEKRLKKEMKLKKKQEKRALKKKEGQKRQ